MPCKNSLLHASCHVSDLHISPSWALPCVCCASLLIQQPSAAAGILPLRCRLLTSLGMEACALTTLLPGALGNADLLKKQVKVKVNLPGLQVNNKRLNHRSKHQLSNL